VFLLVGGFLLTAFVWPGFLLSGPDPDPAPAESRGRGISNESLLRHVPARSNLLVGIDLKAHSFLPWFLDLSFQKAQVQAPPGAGQDPFPFVQIRDAVDGFANLDRLLFAAEVEGLFGNQSVVLAVAKAPLNQAKVRTLFKAGPARTANGKTYYPLPAPNLARKPTFLVMPTEKILMVAEASESELATILAQEGNGALLFATVQFVRDMEDAALWSVVQSRAARTRILDELKRQTPPDLRGSLDAFQKVTTVIASASLQGNQVKVATTLLCVLPEEAQSVKNGAEQLWQKLGQPGLAGALLAFQGNENLKRMLEAAARSVRFEVRDNNRAVVSFEFSQDVLNQLQAAVQARQPGMAGPAKGP
jgi:hypothetical protein